MTLRDSIINKLLNGRRTAKPYPTAHPLVQLDGNGRPTDLYPISTSFCGGFADPLGPVRRNNDSGEYDRLVPHDALHHARRLAASESVTTLVQSGKINTFKLSLVASIDSIAGEVAKISSTEVSVAILPKAKSFETSLQVAKTWVEINQQLVADGLALADSHAENWRFDGKGRPVLIDHGSIVDMRSPFGGTLGYLENWLWPLEIAAKSPALSRWSNGQPVKLSVYASLRPFRGAFISAFSTLGRFARFFHSLRSLNQSAINRVHGESGGGTGKFRVHAWSFDVRFLDTSSGAFARLRDKHREAGGLLIVQV